jgi:cytochrome P450
MDHCAVGPDHPHVQTAERVPEFDVMTIADINDLYGTLGELRRASAVVKATTPLVWIVTRHSDVSALLRDQRLGHQFPRQYVEFQVGDGPATDFQQNILLNRDPPDHTRLRNLMGKAFRGLVVRKLHDHIVDLVDALLAPALDRAEFDVMGNLAFPLPVQVICELLGIEHVDRDEVRTHVVDLVSQEPEAMHRGTRWMRDYIGGLLTQRGPDPEGDLVQRMLAAEDGDDALTHEEIVDNALLLFFAGFETTSNLVANGCVALLEHPDQLARLLSDPSLSALAVEEFLRYDSPVPLVQRIALEPIEVGGRTIKEMRVVLLMLASANHDEDVFERPEDLDIGRSPNPHVGFGGGIHHCMGAMLARVEGQIVFQRLAERVSRFESAGAPQRRRSTIRSFASVPVSVTAA